MPYLVVENFNGGLDSRRTALVAKPGTLVKLENAHITRGGEIEKRKSFVQAFDANGFCSGMVAGKDVLYTFINAENHQPGTYINYSYYPQSGVMLTAVNILHPFDATLDLIRIHSATLFNGKPFCIAEFSGGDIFPFWDGRCISQATGGVIPDDAMDNKDLCRLIAKILNNGQFDGTENFEARADGYLYVQKNGKMVQALFFAQYQDYWAAANENQFLYLHGPVGKEYEVLFTQTSDTINAQDTIALDIAVSESPTKTTPAKPSGVSASFLVSDEYQFRFSAFTDNSGSWNIGGSGSAVIPDGLIVKAVSVNGNDLMVSDVIKTSGQTFEQFFQAIADSINNLTLDHGFTANSYVESGVDYGGFMVKETNTGRTRNTVTYSITLKYPHLAYDTVITSNGTADSYLNVSRWGGRGSGNILGITKAKQGGGVTSITANGVEILGQQINYHGSMPDLAQAITSAINQNSGGHGFSAERSVSTVKISKPNANGSIINISRHGTLTSAADVLTLSSGTASVIGKPQKTKITVTSDDWYVGLAKEYNVELGFQITLPGDGQVYSFGANRISGIRPKIAFTYQGKGYLTDGSVFYFSALNDVTRWDRDATGSGFVDVSNNLGIRDDITGMGLYQGKVAVFTRNDVQLWFVDPDPAQVRLTQSISNTGCIAPKSVTSFGSIDLFYLSDSGLRSLRARDASDAAFMADVGHAIDSLIVEHLSGMTPDERSRAVGFIDPSDGRYWLCIGNTIYVYSYFPGSSIAAWSTYRFQPIETPTSILVNPPEGQGIEAACSCNGRVFIKSGNKIYLYGGESGDHYDASTVTVELPYLDAQKPATYKEAKGVDATCQGEWKIYLGFDHTSPDARDLIATVAQSTFALGRIPATGFGTHFGPKLVSEYYGYARLANFIVHYDDMHSKHEAG